MDARLRSKLRREAVVKSGELVLAAHGPRYPLSALPPASRVIDDLLALQPVPPLHVWLLVAVSCGVAVFFISPHTHRHSSSTTTWAEAQTLWPSSSARSSPQWPPA